MRLYGETIAHPGGWRLDLVAGLALGSENFVKRLLKKQPVDSEEQTAARRATRSKRAPWQEIVRAAEKLLGRTWETMLTCRGDWGRDGTVYVAVRYGGYRLGEVLKHLPGLKYQAAAQGMRRFQRKWSKEKEKVCRKTEAKSQRVRCSVKMDRDQWCAMYKI